MCEPIQSGTRETLTTEDLSPVLERQVGGHDQAITFVRCRNDIEQEFGSGLAGGNVAQFIKDQQVELTERLSVSLQLAFFFGFEELSDQLCNTKEPHTFALGTGGHAEMKSTYARLRLPTGSGLAWADGVQLFKVTLLDEWTAWQALGMDQHSLIADPLFADAAKDDYRLPSGSPAFKLGFRPIPLERIGCYRHGLRASWPVENAEDTPMTGRSP